MKEGNINQPDEATITLWMDGELEGKALQNVEQWAQNHPELLTQREAIRAMNTEISSQIQKNIEPPYPDFFNQQVLRQIHQDQTTEAPVKSALKPSLWQRLTIPAIAAAMALCFVLGNQYGSNRNTTEANTAVQNSSVYTPDGNVSANMFESTDAESLVIVLDGLEDIPDEVEIVSLDNSAWPKSLIASM